MGTNVWLYFVSTLVCLYVCLFLLFLVCCQESFISECISLGVYIIIIDNIIYMYVISQLGVLFDNGKHKCNLIRLLRASRAFITIQQCSVENQKGTIAVQSTFGNSAVLGSQHNIVEQR